MDLNVPTGELDFDLILDIITACQQYQWKYKGDTYIVEASKAHDVLHDPRIIQDYSFYLVLLFESSVGTQVFPMLGSIPQYMDHLLISLLLTCSYFQ